MQYYKTVSLDLASFLIAEDCELFGIDVLENNNQQFVFWFFNTENVKQLTSDFYGMRATVSPQKFIQARRNLKSAIVAKKEDNNAVQNF